MEDRSSWIIIAVAVLGIAAAIGAFYKTPVERRDVEVLRRYRRNPNFQIGVGVFWLLIALGQLVVNWDKIIWNWPLVIVLSFSMAGIIYISAGVEEKIRDGKAKNAKNTEF